MNRVLINTWVNHVRHRHIFQCVNGCTRPRDVVVEGGHGSPRESRQKGAGNAGRSSATCVYSLDPFATCEMDPKNIYKIILYG